MRRRSGWMAAALAAGLALGAGEGAVVQEPEVNRHSGFVKRMA